MDLLRTKPTEGLVEESEEKHGFRRALNGFHLILLGIGAIVGTGIFVLTGTAAAQHAGPAIAVSFIISGLGCLCAGLCYAEFASMLPVSGSAYTYAYATVGELIAWIIGWDLILEYLFGAATVAAGWSGYATALLGDFSIKLPAALCHAPLDFVNGRMALTGAFLNLPAMLVIAVITVVLVFGIRESVQVNNAVVIAKLLVVAAFLVVCFPHIRTENWAPFLPPSQGQVGVFGWTGVLAGAGVIFYAYIGFDAVTTAAQEVKRPQRDIPIGILGSLAICTVLYVLVSLVLTGVVNYRELNVPAPVAFAVERIGPSVAWIKPFIELGALAGLSSVILVLLMGQPRIFHRMAMDGLLPPVFSKVHPRFRTPFVTTIVTGSVTAVFAGLLPIKVLSELVSIGTLLAFVIVSVSIIILRRTRPELERHFRTPWVPFVPACGAVICVAQMVFLPWETWLRLLIWLALGLIIYFGYSRTHSVLHRKGKKVAG
ncbi:MAG TPA: amino acid permease [Chthoniobacterales bacterium]